MNSERAAAHRAAHRILEMTKGRRATIGEIAGVILAEQLVSRRAAVTCAGVHLRFTDQFITAAGIPAGNIVEPLNREHAS